MRGLVILLLFLAVSTMASPAAGDVVGAGADARFTQTIAGTELTVVVRSAAKVPADLRVEVVAYRPVPDLAVHLAIRSTETGHTSRATVTLKRDRPGVHPATLRVTRAGPHELELRAGGDVSVVPFRMLVSAASPWEFLIHGGLYAAGILVVGGLLTGGLSRRPSAFAVYGGATLAVVALTSAALSPALPPPVPDGAAPAPPVPQTGRPYALARVATIPDRPATGEDFTLRLDLHDGSTGRPVDDLNLYHQALAHLVVTSDDGGFFRHLHPLRTAPGRLEARLRADRPGRYLAYAEVEREGSGTQLVSAEFTVTAAAGALAAPAVPAESGAGTGAPVLTPARPVAGRPVTVELDTGQGGIQPWLGMAGHLIVRDREGGFLGHVHESGSMNAGPDVRPPQEGAAAYGPRLRFTFSFPEPGRYLAWVQYARNFHIETVPFVITVAGEDVTP
ncbi:hypothetical protein Misp01_63600 [Microtetraspora sp. NBRC 13810]|uniref:hypothetical protein n=1 Tax=Microtetraspora sp. NBRC 13810 TaxID=3030990 RepID=UPI0024A475D8|nr:hypothetical protein [Microtetraspora sp. NBRC 13810]GLW11232.1 hypothetical protein Misp01_63600 [Microtetraspora sp. NBRC 13810]